MVPSEVGGDGAHRPPLGVVQAKDLRALLLGDPPVTPDHHVTSRRSREPRSPRTSATPFGAAFARPYATGEDASATGTSIGVDGRSQAGNGSFMACGFLGRCRLRDGGRQYRGRRRARFFRRDRIRYRHLPARAEVGLASTPGGAPARRTPVGAVGIAVVSAPPRPRARRTLRRQRDAACAERRDHRAAGAAPESSVHLPATAFEGDDDAEGSSSREFVRIPRNEARAGKRRPGMRKRESMGGGRIRGRTAAESSERRAAGGDGVRRQSPASRDGHAGVRAERVTRGSLQVSGDLRDSGRCRSRVCVQGATARRCAAQERVIVAVDATSLPITDRKGEVEEATGP